MSTPRPPRLERLELGRTAAIGGALAGLCGGLATVILVVQRALLHDLPADAPFAARAALLGSDRAWVGLAAQLGATVALGALFGWWTGVRAGLEQALRGAVGAVVLWTAGLVLLPLLAPALGAGPMAPSLGEYLLCGGLLGLQARFCRWMLHRRWRQRLAAARAAAQLRVWSTSRRPARSP